MSAFETVHHDRVVGKLCGFDRLIFRGHLANFNAPGRMKAFLDSQGVLLKNFDRYVSKATETLKDHAKVAIATGEVFEGSLPRRAARLVAEWVAEHGDELAACWDRATHGEEPGTIEPLQ